MKRFSTFKQAGAITIKLVDGSWNETLVCQSELDALLNAPLMLERLEASKGVVMKK